MTFEVGVFVCITISANNLVLDEAGPHNLIFLYARSSISEYTTLLESMALARRMPWTKGMQYFLTRY